MLNSDESKSDGNILDSNILTMVSNRKQMQREI